jgi:hypothetical protein
MNLKHEHLNTCHENLTKVDIYIVLSLYFDGTVYYFRLLV